MATEIVSKSDLAGLSGNLSDGVKGLKSIFDAMISVLESASDYDGINVTGPANTIVSNIKNITSDFDILSTNISKYVSLLQEFDVDDFDDISFTDDLQEQTNGQTAVNLSDQSGTSGNSTQSWTTAVSTAGSSYAGYSPLSSGSYSSGGGVSSANALDSVITGEMTYTPSGKTSSDGRTQRSALKGFTIKPGIKDDPNIDISKYHNNLEKGFEVTTGNLTYDLCDEDIDLLCAIVAAESDKTYDDALAVITTILNRCETSNWINSHGRDPISQATAPNQFVVYQHGSYERYLNGNAPQTVITAVKDALNGVRNHKYLSFRSNGSTGYSGNMISSTGNRYL